MKCKKVITFALTMVMLFTGSICFKNDALAMMPHQETLKDTGGNAIETDTEYFVKKIILEMQQFQDQFDEPSKRMVYLFGMVISMGEAYETVCDKVDAGIDPIIIINEILGPNYIPTHPHFAILDAEGSLEILHQMQTTRDSLGTMKEILIYLRSFGDELNGMDLKNAMGKLYYMYKTAYNLVCVPGYTIG